MSKQPFSNIQIDLLSESMNISMGTANKQVAVLLNSFGTMHIPKVLVMDLDELQKHFMLQRDGAQIYHNTHQIFSGLFAGECVMVMDDDSVSNLASHFYDNVTHENVNESKNEFTNMVNSSIIMKFAKELNTTIRLSSPTTRTSSPDQILTIVSDKKNTTVILIDTFLEFQKQKINASIYILTNDNSIDNLKILLDKKLELLLAI